MKQKTSILNQLTSRVVASFSWLLPLLASAPAVQAQITNPVTGNLGSDAEAAASGSLFADYFITLWQAIITIGAIMVLIYFLWGAIDWIGAGGDTAKVDKARNRITNSIIGLFLLVFTYSIINYLSFLLFGEDFQILNLSFPGAGN